MNKRRGIVDIKCIEHNMRLIVIFFLSNIQQPIVTSNNETDNLKIEKADKANKVEVAVL